MLDLQPRLQGELLELRPLRADDFPALLKAASDPLIWEQHPKRDRYRPEVFENFFKAALESRGALVAIDRATGEIVGTSRFYNAKETTVAIGYTFLVRRCWGGKFNRELKTLMVNHAFTQAAQVLFEIGETNFRSRAAIEKLGAKIHLAKELDGSPYLEYLVDKKSFRYR